MGAAWERTYASGASQSREGAAMTVKRVGRRLLVLLVILALIAWAALWAVRNVGRWLVAPDALQHARAIVVLSGKLPFRAMEAADLYRQGWAPEVWLLRDEADDVDETFARLGISHPSELDYDQKVLERLGVPKEAIRILEPPTTNTVSEIRLIADEVRRQGGDKAILVTSPVQIRRVKVLWHIVAGDHPRGRANGATAALTFW
jgi:uncharacterized SAM-binding protein YcdF (DUF218 family)